MMGLDYIKGEKQYVDYRKNIMKALKIIGVFFLILLMVVLLLTNVTSNHKYSRRYTIDRQYSYYASPWLYWQFLNCWDCVGSGKIYLYDEVEKEVLGSFKVRRVTLIDAIWEEDKLFFIGEDMERNISNPFILPRPIVSPKTLE